MSQLPLERCEPRDSRPLRQVRSRCRRWVHGTDMRRRSGLDVATRRPPQLSRSRAHVRRSRAESAHPPCALQPSRRRPTRSVRPEPFTAHSLMAGRIDYASPWTGLPCLIHPGPTAVACAGQDHDRRRRQGKAFPNIPQAGLRARHPLLVPRVGLSVRPGLRGRRDRLAPSLPRCRLIASATFRSSRAGGS